MTDAAYFGMIAFVAAEFMASAGWQILCYTGKEAWMSWWQQGMAILLIYGVIAVILIQNSSYSYAKGWTDGNHQKGIFF